MLLQKTKIIIFAQVCLQHRTRIRNIINRTTIIRFDTDDAFVLDDVLYFLYFPVFKEPLFGL